MREEDYGQELIIDIHNCDPSKFNRKCIEIFFIELCDLIDMERCDLHFWDDLYTPEEEKETEPHLVGTSAIQFIKTSSIVIHTLDILKRAYINIFSCKPFDTEKTLKFSLTYFSGEVVNFQVIRRI